MAPANDGRCAAYADGWLPLALQCYLHMLLTPPCTNMMIGSIPTLSSGNLRLQTLTLQMLQQLCFWLHWFLIPLE